MDINVPKRQIDCTTEPFMLRVGKNNGFVSIINYTEQLGFDTTALIDDIFDTFRDRIMHIKAEFPEAVRIDYFLDLYSDDLYIALFRRICGDELDELRFEPLSFYQQAYYRCVSGDTFSHKQICEFRESIGRQLNIHIRGNPYYSFDELFPFKLMRLGDIRSLSLPFDTEYLGTSNPTDEIELRLSTVKSDSTDEYFKDELRSLEVEFAKLAQAI